MALTIRRLEPAAAVALAIAHNKLCASLVGANFHADQTSLTTTDGYISASAAVLTVSAANAADLPTSLVLCANLVQVAKMMMADAVSTNAVSAGAHKVPDATNLVTVNALATAVDLASAILVANGIKTAHNAHCSQAGVHYSNDGTNTIAASNATDLPSLITLLNASKTALNAHIAAAPTVPMINLVSP